jgi:flagellar protein FlhE
VRYLLLTLLGVALTAQGVNGSWSSSAVGGRVSVGQQLLVSRPLAPPGPLPAAARVTRIAWRIELLDPPPPGLRIKLCTPSLCFPLASLSGAQPITQPLSPGETFRFLYSVESRGVLTPALQVVSNRLTLNYR